MEAPVKFVGESGEKRSSQTIVPVRALQLMERLLVDPPETVSLAITDSDIRLKTPSAKMTARLLEGRFPNWREVVVRESNSRGGTGRVDLCVGPLLSAVRQAAIVTDKESRSVDLIFREGSLELTCSTAEVGTSRVDMPISYQGDELPVPLDSKYLVEFLRVLDLQKNVTFSTEGVDRAAEFSTDDGYLYVIMPMERRPRRTTETRETAVTA
jgi:DNA polymerase-3 subunit beta